MKRKYVMFLLVLVLLSGWLGAEKIARMENLVNPNQFVVKDDRMFVADGVTVSIYSFPDLSLIRQFGREGEGPGEFVVRGNLPLQIRRMNNDLYVSSLNKITRYSSKGDLISEYRSQTRDLIILPFGQGFVGKGIFMTDKGIRFCIRMYDQKFSLINELYCEETEMDPRRGRSYNPIDATGPDLIVVNGRLVLSVNAYRDAIKIFSTDGKLVGSSAPLAPLIPLSQRIQDDYIHYLKTDPVFKPIYERTKQFMVFPPYLPLIRYFATDGERLMALSYGDERGNRELYLFRENGTLIQKMNSPLIACNVDEVYPFTLSGKMLYQLVDGDEQWELHRFSIDQ